MTHLTPNHCPTVQIVSKLSPPRDWALSLAKSEPIKLRANIKYFLFAEYFRSIIRHINIMTGPGDLWQLPSLAVCHHFTAIIISFCDRVQYLKLIHLEPSPSPSQPVLALMLLSGWGPPWGCDRGIIPGCELCHDAKCYTVTELLRLYLR